jgi:hypothetical protein
MARTRLCEICKRPIDSERAEGMPDTRLCGQHAEEIEQFGGEFVVTAQQERTSKASSLKINYGGITTSKSRNHAAMERLKQHYENQR